MCAEGPKTDEEKWKLLARHERLGEILLKLGKLNLKQLDDLMKEQVGSDEQLGELIVKKGLMSKEELHQAFELQTKSDKEFAESVHELKEKIKE